MSHERTVSFICLALSVALGCGDVDDGPTSRSSGPTDTSPSTSATVPSPPASSAAPLQVASSVPTGACPSTHDATGNWLVMANEVNNYTFVSTLSFPPVPVAPQSELVFDWSQVTIDFMGHPLDPAGDIDNAVVMLWTLTEAELGTKLNADQLQQQDLAILASTPTEGVATTKRLFEFGTIGLLPGQPPLPPEEFTPFFDIVKFPPEKNTYTVMIGSGASASAGTRMIQAFKLDANSTTTEVVMTNDSTRLEWSVELENLQQTPVPAGTGAITVDWSLMTTTALGTEFRRDTIARVAIVRFSEAPAELEGRFLDLVDYKGDVQAEELWELDVSAGESAVLSSAVDASGATFAGIDDTGTWMLALFCYDCRNPAPWYLTFMTPCFG